MANKQQRKCSSCRRTGHNKRTCKGLEKKSTNTPVFVRVSQRGAPSKHVVDLKNSEQEQNWKEITAYKEKPAKRTERVTINFAQLVQQEQIRKRAARIKPAQLPRVRTRPRVRLPRLSVPQIRFSMPNVRMPRMSFQYNRFIAVGVALLLIAILPFPAIGYYKQVQADGRRVVEESTNAFLALQSSTVAALNSNLAQAQYDLNVALAAFDTAQSIVEKEHQAIVFVARSLPVVGAQVKSRQHILQAGHHLALGNTYLLKGIDAAQHSERPVTERLATLQTHLRSALPQYEGALTELGGVETTAIPAEYQGSFEEFKLLYTAFLDDLRDLEGLLGALNTFLGADDFRQYLVIGQNHHELRPTGGFMGSFAILSVQKGKITRLEIPGGGTYDLQGQLDTYLTPPVPLQVVNPRWEFQDSNWFPDFPASAEKMGWFYQRGRGESVDGVIAINASVLERVLSVIGPVENEEHGIVLAEEGAIETLQYEVEIDYDKEKNKPKEVIDDSLDSILGTIEDGLETSDMLRLLTELIEAFDHKEIQVYSRDANLQETMNEFGWSGSVQTVQQDQDYLMIVNTNIGGSKSDAKVTQTIEHQAVVSEDGSIENTVVLRKTHTGIEDELFYGAANMSYTRFYVPAGAELLEAHGFAYPPEEVFKVPEPWYTEDVDIATIAASETFDSKSGTRITNEFGKTAFGNWMAVAPGETSEVLIRYRLPFTAFGEKEETSKYSMYVQRQSGAEGSFSSTIIYPDSWHPVWRSRDALSLAQNGATIEGPLLTDEVFGFVMTNKQQ